MPNNKTTYWKNMLWSWTLCKISCSWLLCYFMTFPLPYRKSNAPVVWATTLPAANPHRSVSISVPVCHLPSQGWLGITHGGTFCLFVLKALAGDGALSPKEEKKHQGPGRYWFSWQETLIYIKWPPLGLRDGWEGCTKQQQQQRRWPSDKDEIGARCQFLLYYATIGATRGQ